MYCHQGRIILCTCTYFFPIPLIFLAAANLFHSRIMHYYNVPELHDNAISIVITLIFSLLIGRKETIT